MSGNDAHPWPPTSDQLVDAMREVEYAYPAPEDRGTASLSPIGAVEYVEDVGRPGRILVAAAEEGAGKSMAITGELAIRLAVAGGAFAGTWSVLRTGPVLVLSEMHPDDDYQREEMILSSLKLDRSDLIGRYYRLSLMTAAGGAPALMVDEWREWVTGWLREKNALALIIDTGTAATSGDPWGQDMQQVFRNLRLMLEDYPDLLIIVVVHLKKPQGRGGERGLSAVMGEWGRWNDVTLMMENDGASLERVKLTVRKRVRHERRLMLTKRGGLLVDPVAIESGAGTKVKLDAVVTAIEQRPGLTYKALGEALNVAKDTAGRYATQAEDAKRAVRSKVNGEWRVYPALESEADMLAQLQ